MGAAFDDPAVLDHQNHVGGPHRRQPVRDDQRRPPGQRFTERLLDQERVALIPGEALGCPGFIRIGYICDDVYTLMEGVRRLVAFGDRAAAERTADLAADR